MSDEPTTFDWARPLDGSEGSAQEPAGDLLVTKPPRSKKGLVVGLVAAGVAAALVATVAFVSYRRDHTVTAEAAVSESGVTVVRAQGVSLSLPSGWHNVPTTPADFNRYVDQLAASAPDLKQTLDQVSRSGALRSIAMLGVGPVVAGHRDVATLAVVGSVAASQADLQAQLASGVALVHGTGATYRQTTIGGHEGVVADFVMSVGAMPTLHVAELVLTGTKSTVIFSVESSTSSAVKELNELAGTITFG